MPSNQLRARMSRATARIALHGLRNRTGGLCRQLQRQMERNPGPPARREAGGTAA